LKRLVIADGRITKYQYTPYFQEVGKMLMRICFTIFTLIVMGAAQADGESVGGFPSWEERWIHQLINRARSDPQYEMDACGGNCADAACYSPVAPLPWMTQLNRAGRFHSAQLAIVGAMSHDSPCTLVSNIDDLFPESCDGSPSCACEEGTMSCQPVCTSASARAGLFGANYLGDIIANTGGGPNSAFYMWLHEFTASDVCEFTFENGHRWLILKTMGAVGVGNSGSYYTGHFGSGSTPGRIPSGSHYPQQGATVEIWANWYHDSGPLSATVNVAGTCHSMNLERGTPTNGTWNVEVTDVGSGCHRYYFIFEDLPGSLVTFPTTGSLAIGAGDACPDWDISRPAPCDLGDDIFFDSFEAFTVSRQ
jgi:hypothetical protein